jgi:hypothetical protein
MLDEKAARSRRVADKKRIRKVRRASLGHMRYERVRRERWLQEAEDLADIRATTGLGPGPNDNPADWLREYRAAIAQEEDEYEEQWLSNLEAQEKTWHNWEQVGVDDTGDCTEFCTHCDSVHIRHMRIVGADGTVRHETSESF